MSMLPFHWLEAATTKVSATTSSAAGALSKMPTGRVQIRAHNAGTTLAFIRKGTDSTVTALVSDMPLPAGAVEVLTLNNTEKSPITHMAAIYASGSGDVYFTVGTGI